MKDTHLAQVWRDRFIAYSESGLTVTDFCLTNSLDKRSYYYWKRRVAKIDGCVGDKALLPAPSGWINFPSDARNSAPSPPGHTLVVKISGAEIEVDASFNASLLRAVVAALGSQSC